MKEYQVQYTPKHNTISDNDGERIVNINMAITVYEDGDGNIINSYDLIEITRVDDSIFDIEEEDLCNLLSGEDLEGLYEAVEESYCFHCIQE